MHDSTHIFVIGVNHHTAPIEIRERFAFSKNENKEFVQLLKKNIVSECFLLSTCNRTEIFGVTASSTEVENVLRALLVFKSVPYRTVGKYFFTRNNYSAIKHFFELAAGLNSAVLGDVQILNQIREQFSIARETKAAGKVLHRLMRSANVIGERARHETEISKGAVSISYAAVELAMQHFHRPESSSVLLVGAGETGGLTAKHFSLRGMKNVYVANRTKEKAEEIAHFINGRTIDWNDLRGAIHNVDIIISSIGGNQFVLTPEDFKYVDKKVLVIDISIPRSIDPAVNNLEHVEYYDLDSLTTIVEQTLPQRKAEIPKVKCIVAEEFETLNSHWNTSISEQFPPRHFSDTLLWIQQSEPAAVC